MATFTVMDYPFETCDDGLSSNVVFLRHLEINTEKRSMKLVIILLLYVKETQKVWPAFQFCYYRT